MARMEVAKWDSIRQKAQVDAWRDYSEALYYYRKEPRSPFAPVSARDPYPPKPGPSLQAGFGEDSTRKPAPRSDEPMFQEGKAILHDRGYLIKTGGPIVFPAGKALPTPDQLELIKRVAEFSRGVTAPHRLSVVGYADEQDMAAAEDGQDSWSLSTQRATFVVKQLVKTGISSHLLEAVGRGAFHSASDSVRVSVEVFLLPIDPKP